MLIYLSVFAVFATAYKFYSISVSQKMQLLADFRHDIVILRVLAIRQFFKQILLVQSEIYLHRHGFARVVVRGTGYGYCVASLIYIPGRIRHAQKRVHRIGGEFYGVGVRDVAVVVDKIHSEDVSSVRKRIFELNRDRSRVPCSSRTS